MWGAMSEGTFVCGVCERTFVCLGDVRERLCVCVCVRGDV